MVVVVVTLSRSYCCQPMQVRRAIGVRTAAKGVTHGVNRTREQNVGNYMEAES